MVGYDLGSQPMLEHPKIKIERQLTPTTSSQYLTTKWVIFSNKPGYNGRIEYNDNKINNANEVYTTRSLVNLLSGSYKKLTY